ncbi:DUF726 domain-containing protein [Limimaricola cinnabarinus]|uniref:Uncharacterized protein n=1 Tax=Limimaricola cinnabarinus TaxID=1125964 RepID=A0A2G1MBQ5_9RHOB|nr:DUF726 domain-containing protein [Limimaricola cinnabarinus]PHP26167.1 hypothetical protein CJ301_17860 [Limimaricola cinnabarinus]
MSLLRIDARGEIPVPADTKSPSLSSVLARALLAPDVGRGAVVVMVHGYKYQPGHSLHCPHETLFSLSPRHRDLYPRMVSWPRHLGFGRGARDQGLAISFGWSARGTIWSAYAEAARAGSALADLLAQIRRIAPGRPVHAIGHSLGARVILDGLSKSRPGALDLALLLAPAEFAAAAERALDSPAGRSSRCLTVTTRENDVFDLIAMLGIGPTGHGTRMIGHRGLDGETGVTLRIDHAPSLAALQAAGYTVAPPARRICHWAAYLRPGLFRFYRALMSGELDWSRLRSILHEEKAPAREITAPTRLPGQLAPYRAGARIASRINRPANRHGPERCHESFV